MAEPPATGHQVRLEPSGHTFTVAPGETVLEAAIASGRAEVMEAILFSAARPGPAEWSRLRCLSKLQETDDIDEVLDRYKPESAVLECSGVTRPWK